MAMAKVWLAKGLAISIGFSFLVVGAWHLPGIVHVKEPPGREVLKEPPACKITGIIPSHYEQGEDLELTVFVENFFDVFSQIPEVSFFPPAGIRILGTRPVTESEFTVSVEVDERAPLGPRDVTVTNPNGQSCTLGGGFTVTKRSPTIAGVSPPSAEQGQTLELTIFGRGFAYGAEITFCESRDQPRFAPQTPSFRIQVKWNDCQHVWVDILAHRNCKWVIVERNVKFKKTSEPPRVPARRACTFYVQTVETRHEHTHTLWHFDGTEWRIVDEVRIPRPCSARLEVLKDDCRYVWIKVFRVNNDWKWVQVESTRYEKTPAEPPDPRSGKYSACTYYLQTLSKGYEVDYVLWHFNGDVWEKKDTITRTRDEAKQRRITVEFQEVRGDNELTVVATIPKDAATGRWDVIITNPDGQSGILVGGFTLTEPKPRNSDRPAVAPPGDR